MSPRITSIGRRDPIGPRVAARAALAAVGVVFGVLALVGPSIGEGGFALAQATASPSPSGAAPGGGPPTINLLNPSAGYYPALVTDEANGEDTPKVSDEFDGVDRAYHLLAWGGNVPPNAIVEAYIEYPGDDLLGIQPIESTIGPMDPVPGRSDAWELYWEIPNDFSEGGAIIRVRLFTQTAAGIEEVAADEVEVDMEHNDATPAGSDDAEETVEIRWPSSNGQLGFYKGYKGQWRTAIEGTLSNVSTARVAVGYSVTPPGGEPEFKFCQNLQTAQPVANAARLWAYDCALQAKDTPMSVTAIFALAEDIDNAAHGPCCASAANQMTWDSADVHLVQPYVQTVQEMKLSLHSSTTPTDAPDRKRTVILDSSGNSLTFRCLSFIARVTDHLDRPVEGANIDVHLSGPTDRAWFAFDDVDGDSTVLLTGGYKKPDKGVHTTEEGFDCENDEAGEEDTAGYIPNDQAEHNIPGGDDIKHRESAAGTGASSGVQPNLTDAAPFPRGVGQWRWNIRSHVPGISNMTVWIDDEEAANPDERPIDTDTLEPGEPSATIFGQWYAETPKLSFEPAGGSARAGECTKYVLRARSKNDVIPHINVDIHATGPDDGLDFCNPDGATQGRKAPDKGPADNASPHEAEDPEESSHVGQTPRVQHTEAETDETGNLVFGLISPVAGDTTITAWIDGESEFDNDIQDSNEVAATVTHSWATAVGDAEISFLNPSGYGSGGTARAGGDQVSNKTDANSTYPIVVRVDSADLTPTVEVFLGAGASPTMFTKLGDATRVGQSDSYELQWPASVPTDGSYTLRALIPGTTVMEERLITVNNTTRNPNPTTQDPGDSDPAFETIEITGPAAGASAPFNKRALTIEGTASAGADGVDLFYTKAAAKDTPEDASWISCGYVDLAGGTAVQGFRGPCTLTSTDQPSQVTGIAAIALDCRTSDNCDAAPPQPGPGGAPPPPRQALRESGDAQRVFGAEANPLISIEPAEDEAEVDGCERFVMTAFDQTGQAMVGANLDIHVTGPSDNIRFCDVEAGSTRAYPADGQHAADANDPNAGFHDNVDSSDSRHTEGRASGSGRFIFGISSPDVGDTQILGWIDQNDNDLQDTGENSDTSVMHWKTFVEEPPPPKGSCTIVGTSGNDRLEGTSGADVICGRGGNDVLIGRGGNDILKAGRGNDVLQGGAGHDQLKGAPGKDLLKGGSGRDVLTGQAGADRLNGGGGRDRCSGGRGRDRLRRCE